MQSRVHKVDGFQTSIHLKKMKNQERRKISPLCNLDSVLIHNLTSIERSVGFRIRLNRLPVGSFFSGSNSMMDIDKDECIANDTHPCTEATVRVHCNHSNEMSLMYSCRCCLDWLLHFYFLVWLSYCVCSFSQKETLIIDIWSHWCLTIWSYRNSCRDHASHSDDAYYLSSLLTWEDPGEYQSVRIEVEWCAFVVLFSLTLILL